MTLEEKMLAAIAEADGRGEDLHTDEYDPRPTVQICARVAREHFDSISGPDWTGVNEDNIEELLVEAAKSTVETDSISIFVQSENGGTFLSASWRDDEGEVHGVRERSGDPLFRYGITALPGYEIEIRRTNERTMRAGDVDRNIEIQFEGDQRWWIVDGVNHYASGVVSIDVVGAMLPIVLPADREVKVRG